LTLKNSWTEKYFSRKRAGRNSPGIFLGKQTQISSSAILKGMVCCGDHVRIGAGARIENSILLEGTRVGKKAQVTGAIIGFNSVLEDEAQVGPGTVLGDKTRVKRQS
jgi:NDP-sugar pyrophosphorylase family protein